MEKWKGLLTSRKFWASLVSLLVALGILGFSDVQQGDLVDSLLVIVGAILTVIAGLGYSASVAVEDAGRAQGGQNLDK